MCPPYLHTYRVGLAGQDGNDSETSVFGDGFGLPPPPSSPLRFVCMDCHGAEFFRLGLLLLLLGEDSFETMRGNT